MILLTLIISVTFDITLVLIKQSKYMFYMPFICPRSIIKNKPYFVDTLLWLLFSARID